MCLCLYDVSTLIAKSVVVYIISKSKLIMLDVVLYLFTNNQMPLVLWKIILTTSMKD